MHIEGVMLFSRLIASRFSNENEHLNVCQQQCVDKIFDPKQNNFLKSVFRDYLFSLISH